MQPESACLRPPPSRRIAFLCFTSSAGLIRAFLFTSSIRDTFSLKRSRSKMKLQSDLDLTILDLKPNTPKYLQRETNGKLMFTTDPDHCCYLNKTQPMESVLASHDIWINGVRADQSAVRKAMKVEQPAPFDSIRFHPMLDWDKRKIFAYIKEHDLPKHPLDEKGYLSIGCEPCTRKVDLDMQEREARWFGLNKVECGLHTDLVK